MESARAITTGALPGLGGGAPSLPPTEDQTDEIENYLTRIEELTGRVQQLDLTSEQGLEQFFELAREFRGIFFDAVATFDELPPVLEVALNAANTVFAVAGQAAALAYREGVAGGIALLEPEVVDSQAIIEIRPSPLGDGTWDIFFIGGPDGIMLPPELGVDSSRILEIGLLQELDQWNKLFVGGGGDRVLPEGLTADSARVFRIDGVQNIDQWQVIYAAATGADVLPVTLFSNSARVFQIDSLQDLQNWAAIYAQPGDDFLPITVFDGSGRVFQIDSLQAFNSWADLYEGAAEDVLPAPLSAGSERVFQIGELQRLNTWRSIYDSFSTEAPQAPILPPPLVFGSERVFQIGELQTIHNHWFNIFEPFGGNINTRDGFLPFPVVVGSERVVQIGSPQILTSEDLFTFQITPRIIEAASLVRVSGRVSVPVSVDVQSDRPRRI